MRRSSITATFQSDIKTVWNIVTDNNNYTWRSDLIKTEVSDDENSFIEYNKHGFSTVFVITKIELYKQYAFDMKNKNMKGHWSGNFKRTENGGTRIAFTEEICFLNPFMELLSHLFMNLYKMQQTYVFDLKKKLGEL